MADERLVEHLFRALEISVLDRSADGVEHQRDAGERLNRAVVEEEREPPPLVLLGGDQLFGEPCPFGRVVLGAQSMIASRNAIATACVRVSASSFARMWRTWLFTVSWLMKRRCATSAFDIPSASSWRISRSRPGQHVLAVLAAEERGHQRGVDEALAAGDLLDRADERLVRRLLEDVALGARLEAAREQRALAVGREDQHRRVGRSLGELLRRVEPVHPRHAHVHDHDVGPAALREVDRALPVARLTDHPDVGRTGQREAEALTDDLVVVHDQAGDLGGHEVMVSR